MFSKIMLNDLFLHLLNTGIALVAIFILSLIVYFAIRKKVESSRERQKIKYRIGYISVTIFLLVLVRIWVEGFTHLFAMLSLIAAGLVVTNKESIMNIMGWLILNWRGIFSIGDYIQIQNYVGYVESIKLFNFKLIETTGLGIPVATGKTIKVPNGLLITNPISLVTGDNTLALQNLELAVGDNDQAVASIEQFKATITELLTDYYKDNKYYSIKYIKQQNKDMAHFLNLEPTVMLELTAKKDESLLKISFYSFPKDAGILKQQLDIKIKTMLNGS